MGEEVTYSSYIEGVRLRIGGVRSGERVGDSTLAGGGGMKLRPGLCIPSLPRKPFVSLDEGPDLLKVV